MIRSPWVTADNPYGLRPGFYNGNTHDGGLSTDDHFSRLSVEEFVPDSQQTASDTAIEQTSDMADPDGTISDSGDGPVLVRCGFQDAVKDYIHLFQRLQLKPDFYDGFFTYVKEFREEDQVKALLADASNRGIRDVAGKFLERYGKRVWKLQGKFCKQDRASFRHTMFDIKVDSDKLMPILDELFHRVRSLIYINARSPSEEEDAASPKDRSQALEEPAFVPKYPAPFTTPAPTDVTLDSDEEDLAVKFINKVRIDVHKLPGNVKRRGGKKKRKV